ncbi:MAG: carbohydrate ABC transporter permease [Spirochaetia bacterium]
MRARYIRKSVGSRIFDASNVAFLLLFTFLVLYPFYNQLVISFNQGIDAQRGGIYFFPRAFTLDSYAWLFKNSKLLTGAVVSLLRVAVGTSTCLFASALLGYITAIRYFSGRRFMRILFVITMYFGGGMIPTYLLMLKLGLLNTFTIYWLPYLISPYYMLIISSYLNQVPDSLFEAARVDGASELRIFFQIVVPISVPLLAAVSIYLMVWQWNQWFDNMLYNTKGNWDTLQMYLRRMLLQSEIALKIQAEAVAYHKFMSMTPQTIKAATTMIVTIPILVTYPFFQRYFIGGITLGSVK